jgi:Mg2+/Co2+ transporter CorB
MAKENHTRAKLTLRLQQNMGSVIATILLFNTFIFTSLSAIVTSVLTTLVGPTSAALYASIFVTAFTTIYLEVLPKVIAFARPEAIAIRLSPVIEILWRLLTPLIRLVDFVARISLKVVGYLPKKPFEESSVEDLRGMIDLHVGSEKALKERLMLRSILDMTTVTLSDVARHRKQMVSFDVNQSPEYLMREILKTPYTRIPLWEGTPENVIGTLHIRQLFTALQKETIETVNLRSLLKDPWFVPETTTLTAQLQAFRDRQVHFAFVVDEYGTLSGFITLEDILEQIVGDIEDESDVTLPGVRSVRGEGYLIQGDVRLRDLNRMYDWRLPEGEASTLSGLLLEVSEKIPEVGEHFHLFGLEIHVLEKKENAVSLLRVKKEPEASEETS